jgi:hypothetical protein
VGCALIWITMWIWIQWRGIGPKDRVVHAAMQEGLAGLNSGGTQDPRQRGVGI